MPRVPRRRQLLRALLASAVASALAGCFRKAPAVQPVPRGAVVLALGDSLTAGHCVPAEQAWPALLAQHSGWQVHNAGVSGDTSAQALARLPPLLAELRPALVIVGIGGNDLLRRGDEAALRANLLAIVHAVRAAGAQVMLIAFPKPNAAAALGFLGDHPLYGELAEREQLLLQRQGWAEVLGEEALRCDRIHANAQGHAAFARALVATARAGGLLASGA